MMISHSTYAKFLKYDTIRLDATHAIAVVFYINYKGLYDLFYVNMLDEKQKEMFLQFMKSDKQMKITLGQYKRKTNKEYLMDLKDEQYK